MGQWRRLRQQKLRVLKMQVAFMRNVKRRQFSRAVSLIEGVYVTVSVTVTAFATGTVTLTKAATDTEGI